MKTYRITTVIGVLLTLFCLACRLWVAVADAYALHVYPVVSDVLSWLSAWLPFPLQELLVLLLIAVAVAFIVLGYRKQLAWRRVACYELTLLMWTYVWFYMSWCNNYTRSSIFARAETPHSQYDETQFKAFVSDFTDSINANWTADTFTDLAVLEAETKRFFADVPECYGLTTPRSWHRPKGMLLNRFYSAVGVQGFIAPLLAESCVNADLLPSEYPFVYMHEYSHMLGVSNEAEAHWWAFQCSTHSGYQSVRYSGYKDILPHVMVNARRLLSEAEYREWVAQLRPEVKEDVRKSSEHWQALRSSWLDTMQSEIYDLFLKSNRIESGRKNYSQVVDLIISLRFGVGGS